VSWGVSIYSKRDFTYGTNSQKDMFFLYDNLSRVTCRTDTYQASCPANGSGQTVYESLTYNQSFDRTKLVLKNNALAEQTYWTKFVSSTSDKINCVIKGGDGACSASPPVAGQIVFAWDGRGNRIKDDDGDFLSPDDKRTYTYDARNNLITVSGRYRYGVNDFNPYVMTSAYDERNRRIFKSFVDSDLGTQAQWFFYYDQFDRLVEMKHTPNIASPSTYSVYQWYWLKDIPFLYYQTDYPAATVTRRYLHSDEQGRPHAAWSWPSTGDTARVWEAEAGTFGWDIPVVGATVMQPLRFPGQFYDKETEAWATVSSVDVIRRPGLCDNRYRVYDELTGSYLQSDPELDVTWHAYAYAQQDSVMASDPSGRLVNLTPLSGSSCLVQSYDSIDLSTQDDTAYYGDLDPIAGTSSSFSASHEGFFFSSVALSAISCGSKENPCDKCFAHITGSGCAVAQDTPAACENCVKTKPLQGRKYLERCRDCGGSVSAACAATCEIVMKDYCKRAAEPLPRVVPGVVIPLGPDGAK